MPEKELKPGSSEFLKEAFKADQACLLANLQSSNRVLRGRNPSAILWQ